MGGIQSIVWGVMFNTNKKHKCEESHWVKKRKKKEHKPCLRLANNLFGVVNCEGKGLKIRPGISVLECQIQEFSS